jgi:hypothetical protein
MDHLRALTAATAPPPSRRGASWREMAPILQRDAEVKLLQVRVEWLQNARRVMKAVLEQPGGGGRA